MKINKGKMTKKTHQYFHEFMSWLLGRNSASQKGVAECVLSDEKEKPTTKNTLLSKHIIQIWGRNQKLFKQAKVKNSTLSEKLYNKYKRNSSR